MDKIIEVLRHLADGVRGPVVHGLIDELESALLPGEPEAGQEAAAPEPEGAPA